MAGSRPFVIGNGLLVFGFCLANQDDVIDVCTIELYRLPRGVVRQSFNEGGSANEGG